MSQTKLRQLQADRSLLAQEELAAGYKTLQVGTSYSVTTASAGPGLGLITFTAVSLHLLEITAGDTVTLTGAGALNGDYEVSSVVSATQLQVITPVLFTAGSATATLFFAPGATYIGVNDTALTLLTGSTVQKALEQIDTEIQNRTTNFQFNTSAGISTTTSTTFSTKITLNAGVLEAGDYLIGWFYNWYYTATNTDFRGQIVYNGGTVVMTHRQEPQDAGTDQRHVCSGTQISTLSAGSATLTLQWAAAAGGVTAGIVDAQLWIYKIPS